MKITSVCGRILLGALNLFSSPELGHFFDNRLLLANSICSGLYIVFGDLPDSKGLPRSAPNQKRKKNEEDSSSPSQTERKEAGPPPY